MQDTEFMDKELVLKAWKRFLVNGLRWENFSKRLYKHLTLHCSFIAHFSREGFYATYFKSGDRIAKFLSQFDARNSDLIDNVPPSIEYGMTYWAAAKNGNEYADINQAMIEAATPYMDDLLEKAQAAQRAADIGEAKQLLAKHGIAIKET